MSLKQRLVKRLNSLLSLIDAQIVKKSRLEKFNKIDGSFFMPPFSRPSLPPGSGDYLCYDNPRLMELRHQYRSSGHPAVEQSLWTDERVSKELDLDIFRGDLGYVLQYKDMNSEINYILTAYYIKSIDDLGLLNLLAEDNLFGAQVFDVDDKLTVSRDLLDSIVEIIFLEHTLGISTRSKINILDIGSGYGLLAHRMAMSFPGLGNVFCVDAVAISTFLCEYYLRFRGVDKKAVTVPLQELESVLASNTIHLATNIHSFSECGMVAINWWLDILKEYRVQYLMIVPNAGGHGGTRLLSTEKDGRHIDFLPSVHERGYRIINRRPKYIDTSIQKYGVSPTYHYLFELIPDYPAKTLKYDSAENASDARR